MFNYIDEDNDGVLNYQDFANMKEQFLGSVKAPSQASKSSTPSVDPFSSMAKNVHQRTEYDLMEWNDDISGKSSEQRRFKLNHITGGKFTPREFGGT